MPSKHDRSLYFQKYYLEHKQKILERVSVSRELIKTEEKCQEMATGLKKINRPITINFIL